MKAFFRTTLSVFRHLVRPTAFRQLYLPQVRLLSSTIRNIANPMEPSKVKYEYIDPHEVERVEYYVHGGYHPVKIGDEFHGRYVIVHKLGFGGSATTWLAEDKQDNQLIALKTSTAESAEVISTSRKF